MPEVVINKLCKLIGHMSGVADMYGSTVVRSMIDEDTKACVEAINLLKTIPGTAKRKPVYEGVVCGNCGRRVHYDSAYCDKCGWRFEE